MSVFEAADNALQALYPYRTPDQVDRPRLDVRTSSKPRHLGVAVSGGGDSMALLHFMVDFCRLHGETLQAVTVDHGLRPEAAAEATFVAETCATLDVPHTTLRWAGWTGAGNVQAAARKARYGLMAEWAQQCDIEAVAVGHTADDLAETVLMNFARGSGVDGLRGMPPLLETGGMWFVRPLLGISRADLRSYLQERGAGWIEDPSNEDTRFNRVRARNLLDSLADLGLTRERLLDTAERMRDAREVLNTSARKLVRSISFHAGDVLLPLFEFQAAPNDTRHRVLAAILCALSGQNYRPRFGPLQTLAREVGVVGRGGCVLHGCIVTSGYYPGLRTNRHLCLRFTREAAALEDVIAAPGEVWDGRFVVTGPSMPDDEVRALGEAAMGPLPDVRDTSIPRRSLMASPAVWRHGEMIAAPMAGIGKGWTCEAVMTEQSILSILRSR